jgi:hypothetical protein
MVRVGVQGHRVRVLLLRGRNLFGLLGMFLLGGVGMELVVGGIVFRMGIVAF